jgi:hypothetical protein
MPVSGTESPCTEPVPQACCCIVQLLEFFWRHERGVIESCMPAQLRGCLVMHVQNARIHHSGIEQKNTDVELQQAQAAACLAAPACRRIIMVSFIGSSLIQNTSSPSSPGPILPPAATSTPSFQLLTSFPPPSLSLPLPPPASLSAD